MSTQHHALLIVDGGAAGVSVANTMRRQNASINITLIEPSDKHYYQPGFTLVGGGAYTLKQTLRNEVDLIHPGVTWIKDCAETFSPRKIRSLYVPVTASVTTIWWCVPACNWIGIKLPA